MSDPFKDFDKAQSDAFKMQVDLWREEANREETFGIRALNHKMHSLIDLVITATESSNKVSAKTIRLQKEVNILTRKLNCMTITLIVLTILMAILAPFSAYTGAKEMINDIARAKHTDSGDNKGNLDKPKGDKKE